MALRFSPNRGAAAITLNALTRGPTGVAATIAVGTTTTLVEGSAATAVNSGTTGAAVLDFGIPRGAMPATGFNFDTSTTDADPGAGDVRFNNATPASVTAIYFDNVDRDGNTVTAWLDSFDDSTSTHKGTLTFTPSATPSAKLIYTVSGTVVDGTGYRKVTVTHVAGTTLPTAAAHLGVVFARTGQAGADGEVAGPASAVIGNLASFGATDGNTIADSGVAPSIDGTFAANSDAKLPTEKAVKTYADGLITAIRNGVSSAFDTLAEIATELALKAVIASPTFTGVPAAPTAASGTNTTQVATTAFVKTEIPLVAMGQGKHTIWIPASAMWARTTNGPGAASRELTTGGDIMVKGLAFDTTTEEAAQFYIAFPKSWNKGTITFQAFWTNVSGLTTETVSWGLSAGAYTDSDAIDSTDLGTEVRVSDTWLAANDIHVSPESGAVTVGNTPIDDDMTIGQIARSVANDNMTGDAELLGIKIFYTTSAATDA